MNEEQANTIAEVFGGTAWHSGGNVWLVLVERPDGSLVVLSDEVVCDYADEAAFHANKPSASILLH
ncbi:MAG: hypothetical protein IH624_02650 [Phycisphaerae bacterium]|nr:hypothetical protein [Phycisphaerae bacterium]